MNLGVISDTHGVLSPLVARHFQFVEMILHAGDIGSDQILDKLADMAPLLAVKGNMDYAGRAASLPATISRTLNGINFLITHNIGDMRSFHKEIEKRSKGAVPEIVIFGHTHRAVFQKLGSTTFINPGSALESRDHRRPSVMLLQIDPGRIVSHELITLW